MDLFKTKQSQDIKKQNKTKTEIIKSFENIFVTFNFLKLSNQPNKLLSISRGRGRAGGLACLCGDREPGTCGLFAWSSRHPFFWE